MAEDVILGPVSLLAGTPEVLTLVGLDVRGRPRVHAEEMPKGFAKEHPRYTVLLKSIPMGGDPGGMLELETPGLEVLCFGETFQQAKLLSRKCHAVLKNAERGVHNGILIHWFNLITSAQPLRDAEAGWPLVREVWQYMASENPIV